MAKYDFVYFDLDDTLLDHRHAERCALGDVVEELPALADVELEEVRQVYHRINRDLWKDYAAGTIDRDTLRVQRFAKLLTELGVEQVEAQSLGDRYMSRYADHWRPIPNAVEALRRIAIHIRVGLITNGFAEVQRRKLERFPEIAQLLAATVISEEVGVMKPHPALFAAAEEEARSDGPVLYVGDSFHSDVVGALNAGWSAAWYQPAQPDEAGRSAGEDHNGEKELKDLLDSNPLRNGSAAMRFSDWNAFTQFALDS